MKAYLYNLAMFHTNYDFDSDKVIFEVDDPKIYDIYLHNGTYYVVSMVSNKLGVCGVKKTEYNTAGEEHSFEHYIKCPYCNHEDADSWEQSGDDGEIECGACGSTFFFERDVSVSYTTVPVKAQEVKIIK